MIIEKLVTGFYMDTARNSVGRKVKISVFVDRLRLENQRKILRVINN